MEFIDTHTHLFTEEFNMDRDAMVQRAIQSRVKTMLLPNIDLGSIDALKACCDANTFNCLPMMGLHPSSVDADYKTALHVIQTELDSGYRYMAVGEIGIDLYWDKSLFELQKDAFVTQCNWAVERQMAVSIHTRSATYETIACLKQMKTMPKGVFHCFSGSEEEAREIIKLGFKLGIGGVVTYKNANLPEVLKAIGPDHLVLETDAPYLPPVPYRGKRNESSYIPFVAEKLSHIFGISVETVAQITTAGAKAVFGI